VNSRQIIADAWNFTREHMQLMWWYAFIPSLVNTLVGILYMVYQFFAFKRSELFDNAPQSFLTEVIKTVLSFLNQHANLWIPFVVVTIIVLVLYLLLPTLCQGALIQIIAKKRQGAEARALDGIALGLLVFLPLLEYHLLVNGFSMFSVFTEAAFVLRNLGTVAMTTLLPVFVIATLIAFILTLLFTYADFFIVLRRVPILKAIGKSAKLVVVSWQHTFIIAILMLIIGLRVIINIVAVLLVPALLLLGASFFAVTAFTKISIIISAIVAVIGLLVASYFTGILNLFANTVWTYTFLALMEEKKTQELMEE